ncbi:APC membrane recruitment protein 2-like isoform X3 [Archocentrus centrarchus]|uniref:APC membrane recruitment protein 2-like isoform X3 n=1 Tax=Archocentrus centrarchus TaxID=63155 RepID=UPI0011E9C7E2|nr:APC membrane recruitment protein 2-like isoform X3 [Archocentrus centrarchus]
MDVQTENVDPPPCESQPSGKIRKGFKLFGKRKPGNIFSIRSKGDGNNKSPVHRSKTLDGLSESPAPDSEREPDKEKGHEGSEAEREQAEEEPLGEDGVLAAAPARNSISSASSAKSLSFLSLLRGGRRGVGDRQVHTVSQPVGRQRRGLKGLFGNVKFKSKDKEDKEEVPPSPLLMSSRANSVEIIKEDLTLTPKSQPRSLDSPETESREHVKSLTIPDSAAPSPPEPTTPQATTGSVSKTNENVAPSPTSEPPLIPGDTSLSSLLADISSLLTFDSITGGGDIMADVEAEWGKASSALSAVVTEVTPSSTAPLPKPSVSSPLTLTTFSTAFTAKPSHVAVPTTTSPQSFTPLSKATTTSSPFSKPSTIITTFTKSSTLTTPSVKLSSDSTPASEPSASVKIITAPAPATTKPSTVPVTSAPMSSSLITLKSTVSSTSTTTTAPPNTPASVVKAPSVSPILTSTASKLASQTALPPQTTTSVSKPSPVATSPPVSIKPPPVTHSPPIPAAITQPPPAKSDLSSTSCKPSLSSVAGDSKAPATVSPPCTVTAKSSSPDLGVLSKTAVLTSTATSASVSAAPSKPTLTSTLTEQNKSPPSHVTVPDICLPTSKTQPSPACFPTPASISSDKLPPTTKLTSAPVLLDKTPTPIPAPTTHTVVSAAPTALGHIPVSLSKDQPATAQTQISQSKAPPAPVQVPVSVCKDLPAPAQKEAPQSKAPPAPAQFPVSVSKDLPAPAQKEPPQSKAPPAPAQFPVSVSKDLPVRDSQQQVDEEPNRNPPTPVLEEERPNFNSHDAGNKDKISAVEATSKHIPEDSQQPQHPKVLVSSTRDSKIPVKHGAQTHTASQIPQNKEPPRTKIPVSKVPVRRVGNKPGHALRKGSGSHLNTKQHQ